MELENSVSNHILYRLPEYFLGIFFPIALPNWITFPAFNTFDTHRHSFRPGPWNFVEPCLLLTKAVGFAGPYTFHSPRPVTQGSLVGKLQTPFHNFYPLRKAGEEFPSHTFMGWPRRGWSCLRHVPVNILPNHIREEGTPRDTLRLSIQHHLHPLSDNHSSSSGIQLGVFWSLELFTSVCSTSDGSRPLFPTLTPSRRRCYTTPSIWPISLTLSQLNFTLLLTRNSEISHEAGSLQAGKDSWTEGNWLELV